MQENKAIGFIFNTHEKSRILRINYNDAKNKSENFVGLSFYPPLCFKLTKILKIPFFVLFFKLNIPPPPIKFISTKSPNSDFVSGVSIMYTLQ